jgi:chromosome partitioning protein
VKTISILSQKGGCGKTTVAVHLAICAILNNLKTVLIDMDPQGSAFSWNNSRGKEKLEAYKGDGDDLQFMHSELSARGDVDLLVVDTPPHTTSHAAIAASLSDFVIIPCRPARFDLEGIANSATIAKLARVPYMVLLSAAPRSKITKESRAVVTALKLPLYFGQISNLVAYSHAVIDGRSVHEFEPAGKAASEISCLYACIEQELWDRSVDAGGNQ